jgi:hypothetical protein
MDAIRFSLDFSGDSTSRPDASGDMKDVNLAALSRSPIVKRGGQVATLF